ncbi:LacI family DNA-binding transcriptional regulator [Streptomyces sp. NBC_01537]|uniref:LacI family DNA-binding transcriptional regulator n=1 Tax=Streptomyces sp. NBC_01537 TaxID=2903896 RepID=UPI003863671C
MTPDRRVPGEPSARPTIKAVAQHAGVSYQTVSNAINAPDRLKPDTLARVLESIEALGYKPSQAARNLRTQSTGMIGFRFSRSSGSGIASIEDRFLHALSVAGRERGYGVIVFCADDDDDEIVMYADLLGRNAVDGFILMNSHSADQRTTWLSDREIPFVSFGRPWSEPARPYSWIDVDGASGVRLAVQDLAAAGHRRIGFIGWNPGDEVGDDRYAGWLETTKALDLPSEGLAARGPGGIAGGAVLAEQLLSAPAPPTALVCVCDATAVGAMQAVRQRGQTVGRDVAVIGFDDSPLCTVVQPTLTSLRQPLESVARRCVDLLAEHIDDPNRPPHTSIVEPALVQRESSTTATSE